MLEMAEKLLSADPVVTPAAPKKARKPQARKAKQEAPAPPKTAAKEKTREQWLEQAVRAMDKAILKPLGYAMPELWKITCGFARSSGHKAIGQCWPPSRAADGKTTHLMVCSTLGEDAVRVLDIVLHEMGHAAVGCEHMHKKPFRDFVKAVGLDGKVTATIATPGGELHGKLTKIAERLGAYPHPAIRPGTTKAKAGGGWIRLVSPDCEDYKVVVSPKAVEEHGLPKDPWGNEMVPANADARAALGH